MSKPSVRSPRSTPKIIIIGAGFSGLGVAIQLKQAGYQDFTILEQDDQIGGTWYRNNYPGAACDVMSHMYSYSFAPNPQWPRMYSEQKEIWSYQKDCAKKYELMPHVRCKSEVTRAAFDDVSGKWTVTVNGKEKLEADIVISGTGALCKPKLPDIPGIDTFAGEVFHSARWDHSYDLSGKTAAVIGTGASSIQFVPQIQPKVARLHLFQRTPPWIMPKPDRAMKNYEKWLFGKIPLVQKIYRAAIYGISEFRAIGFVIHPKLMTWAQSLSVRHLHSQVKDPVLRRKLTPTYTMGCKRVLISNDYFPALAQPNAEVVTEGIVKITRNSVITGDGIERKVDALILGTGFYVTDAGAPFEVKGAGGVDLNTVWKQGAEAEAYLGTTVAGFPNLFLMVGPNTGLGHNSIIYMIESQISLIMDTLRQMKKRNVRFVSVRPEVQRKYNEALQARLKKTVWASGCQSWYLGPTGKNPTLWPGFTFEFRNKTRRLKADDYQWVA